MKRYLIVNADDFGLSEGVNRGIVRAHHEGILTSASLMVRGAAAAHAVELAGTIGLGLHIDLGEWAYRDGQWVCAYQRVPLDERTAVEAEIRAQLDAFNRLTGIWPTHLDAHQHVHRQQPVRGIALCVAAELNVPLRGFAKEVRYCGSFYGQTGKGAPYPHAIGVDALLSLLSALPPGITELGCHPGQDHDLDSRYRTERIREVNTLCHPRVRAAVSAMGILLTTFEQCRTAHFDDAVGRFERPAGQPIPTSTSK